MTSYVRREIVPALIRALSDMPVVVLTGMRQAGKTTVLRRDAAFTGRRYVTFDDFAALEEARRDPEGFVSGEGPLTIDEAQRCPELFVALKRAVDRDRRPGRFLLSGSANFALLKEIGESLAGRAIHFELLPFGLREVAGRTRATPALVALLEGRWPRVAEADVVPDEAVLDGGMPSVVLGEVTDREVWFRGFEQTYLERDVRDLSRLTDLTGFRTLLRLACLRTARVLNVSQLGRDAGLKVDRTERYLSILEASFLVRRVPPFLASRSTRLIKSPKLLVTDSGLAAHMAAVDDLARDPSRGPLIETWVAQNLRAVLEVHRPRAELLYWSVQGRHEVDFVVAEGRRVVAIEVKASARFSDDDLRSLRAFRAKGPSGSLGVLAYNGTRTVRIEEGLAAVPFRILLG